MADAKTRLLNAAERLAYRSGVHATGIDSVLREAGAAKMSLYNNFGGKEGLMLAMMDRRHEMWMAWFERRVRALADTAGGLIPGMFRALGEWFANPEFNGCLFVNAAAEFPKPSSKVRQLAERHKRELAELVARFADEAGPAAPPPAMLMILIEGAISVALVSRRPDAAETAEAAARRLMSPDDPAR